MNKFFLFASLFCGMLLFSLSADAQTKNEQRIREIPSEIETAVEQENFKEAAKLKKEKELRLELEEAVKKEDYQRASEIKDMLETGSYSKGGGRIAQLEKEMEQAVEKEDYKKASRLKKQIRALKAGEPVPENTTASPSPAVTSNQNVPAAGIDPPFVNQVYFLAADGSIHELEKEEGELKTSGGGFGYAHATSSYVVSGAKSPVRIDKSQLNFVVEVYQGIDPSDQIKLVKLDVRGRGKDRFADAYTASASMFHSESNKVDENEVNVAFKPIGDSIYQIIIKDNIETGEYAFMHISKMYAFGVD